MACWGVAAISNRILPAHNSDKGYYMTGTVMTLATPTLELYCFAGSVRCFRAYTLYLYPRFHCLLMAELFRSVSSVTQPFIFYGSINEK